MNEDLTQEELKKILHYCPLTGVLTWLNSTQGTNRGDVAGWKQQKKSKHYRIVCIRYKKYAAHRLAYLYQTGHWPKAQMDHINGNGMDNRWANLREATNQENSKNQRLRSTNKSGTTGVLWEADRNLWRAEITIDGKNKYIGRFDNIEDAAVARKQAEIANNFHENHGQDRPL